MATDRVIEQLEAWREALINLTRNNRLLYFQFFEKQKGRSSTLEIIRPSADRLLERLAGSGVPVWEPPEEPPDLLLQSASVDSSSGYSTRPTLPAPPDAFTHALPENVAVSDVRNREQLRRILKNLDRRTNQEFLDRGLWILYLALGFVDWIDQPRDTGQPERVCSPLILLPVALQKEGAASRYRLRLADEDATTNPALAFKLQHDFGISLPSVEGDLEDVSEAFQRARDAIANRPDWSLSERVVLSVFSFHKEVMYRDLQRNEAMISSHPAIRSLALGHRSDEGLGFVEVEERQLDEAHPPEQVPTILDADASQRQCLAAAARGHSFVMEGPPGTGKSQTIANIIAEALAAGRTVLFVSEKAAALEVVYNRLDQAKLGEFVLELHSHKATRKEVAQALGGSLNTRVTAKHAFTGEELHQLATNRQALSDYAHALNEERPPLGRTVHNVLGQLMKLGNMPQLAAKVEIDASLSAAQLAEILQWAEALGRAWAPVSKGDSFLWRGLRDGVLTQGRRAHLIDLLARGAATLREVRTHGRSLRAELDLGWDLSVAEAERLAELAALINSRRAIPLRWLVDNSVAAAEKRVLELQAAVEQFNKLRLSLQSLVGNGWRELEINRLPSFRAWRLLASSSPLPLPGAIHSADEGTRLAVRFTYAAAHARELHSAGRTLAGEMNVESQDSVPRIRDLVAIGAVVDEPCRPDALWLTNSALASAQAAVEQLEQRVAAVVRARDRVRELFNDRVLDLDADALHFRFVKVHLGLAKLRLQHWRDRRALSQCTKSGRARGEDIAGLIRVVELHASENALARAERDQAKFVGPHYYRGLDTSFAALKEALKHAEAIVRLGAGWVPPVSLTRVCLQAVEATDLAASCRAARSALTAFTTACESVGAEFQQWAAQSELSPLTSTCQDVAASLSAMCSAWQNVTRVAGRTLTVAEAEHYLELAQQVREIEHQLIRDMPRDRDLLGENYVGADTHLAELQADIDWTKQVLRVNRGTFSVNSAQRILMIDPVLGSPLGEATAGWLAIREELLTEFDEGGSAELSPDLGGPFEDAEALLMAFAESVDDIAEWGAHVRAASELKRLGVQGAVAEARTKGLAAELVAATILRSVLEAWTDDIRRKDPRLSDFRSRDRDGLAAAFRSLDRRYISMTPARVIEACNARRPTMSGGAAGLIASEANKQKRHMPTRKLIEATQGVVQALKPCLMMSPLTVSQFLPPTMRFDLVIFDEASQVRPSDAINCIYRGNQLIIAGDQKQLPPTPFFDAVDAEGDQWEEEQLEVYESVLDVAKGSGGFRSMPLRWHYRSQHEDLITYSNYSFYDGKLVTFPSAQTSGQDIGVEMYVVPGVYRRGGARDNPIEAAKVVERVLYHLREHPSLSIGVVAFSEAQASTIDDEIERRTSEYPELRVMRERDRLRGGFVKNLESVQGDERDVIIFSVGYGRDEAGKFTLNFGPINKSGGQRRLNVAITRARRRVEIIASITAADFRGDLGTDGVRHLRRYLEFAERRDNRLAVLAAEVAPSGRDLESPFEEEVARLIRSWGYDVTPQVGCAEYRIDMAVRDPAAPSRYILGVECDGAMYHSSRVARDRDRLRQEVLARLGWTHLHRVWGLSWYSNRGAEEVRLREAIQAAIDRQQSATTTVATETRIVETASVAVELPDIPSWVVPYSAVVPGAPTCTAAMHEGAAQPELQRMIHEVVSGESPVSFEVVLRRVRARWGVNRAGSRIRSSFQTAVSSLVRRELVKVDADRFLRLPGAAVVRVRSGRRETPETMRSMDEIPSDELDEALIRFVAELHSVTEDELTARIASVFGWERRGPDIAEALGRAIRSLVSRRRIKRDGALLAVNA